MLSANHMPDGHLTTLPWPFPVIHTTIIINPKYWTAKTIPYRTGQHENRCYGVLISASQWSKTEVRRCLMWQSWVSAIVFSSLCPTANGSPSKGVCWILPRVPRWHHSGADTFERWLVVILPMSLWRLRSSIILYNDTDTQDVLPHEDHFCSRYSIYQDLGDDGKVSPDYKKAW